MTHLSSTSVRLSRVSSSLQKKAWIVYHTKMRLWISVECSIVHPTKVHTQIIILRCSYIDYSHEFVGTALARFERSTLPEHKGTRTLVLRFLKIIKPVKCVIQLYDDLKCCPKEGELYRRSTYGTDVWSINIDQRSEYRSALQLLWHT
jgi:hypothetical protein